MNFLLPSWWKYKIKCLIIKITIRILRPIARKVGLYILAPLLGKYLNAILSTKNSSDLSKLISARTANTLHATPLENGEKVRIVFIFQSASFWPSWESLWVACSEDSRFKPRMLVCDDPIKEKVQFATAREFLTKSGIEFDYVGDVDLSQIDPHLVVLHTPYDGHRPNAFRSSILTARGFRIVYIPYGIEISDSNKARSDHFMGDVVNLAWRIYTFTDAMFVEYRMRSKFAGEAIRCFGHPKFDGLQKLIGKGLPTSIAKKVKGRKVVLWKVHFPKEVGGKLITPAPSEYLNFAKSMSQYSDLFFVFMPHPKFYEKMELFGGAQNFKKTLEACGNAIQYDEDDYRQVLMNCDYYMIDRSSLMIEAGVTDRPILYIENASYSEPMTPPVQEIIDTYYKASTAEEIRQFIEKVVLNEMDERKEKRVSTIKKYIKYTDGNNGNRIKEDIYKSLLSENKRNAERDENVVSLLAQQ